MRFSHCKDLTGEWDYERLRTETYYSCEKCDGEIHEHHKPAMLAGMQVLPTNLNQDKDHRRVPRKLGLQISDLYSTFTGSHWGDLAVEWIEAQGSPSKRQNFFNSRLGEPEPEREMMIQLPLVGKLRGGYDIGCCPKLPAFSLDGRPAIFVAADVQQDVKKWVKGVFRPDGELFIVDYGETLSYGDLEVQLETAVVCGVNKENEAGAQLFTGDLGVIDEGHDTMNVRSFCIRSGMFFPVKGRGGLQTSHMRDVVDERTAEHEGQVMSVYHFSDDDFKRELYLQRIGKIRDIIKGESMIPRTWLPAYADQELMAELCQERRIKKRVKGKEVWAWDEPRGPNDFGDAVKMLIIMWYRVREYFPLSSPPEPKG